MRPLERTLYWSTAGGLLGLGFVAFGLALLPTLFGSILALYGVKRFGPHGFWITIVAIGIVPTSVLLYRYVTVDPATTLGPNPLAPVAVFGTLALAGVIWGLIEARRGRGPGASTSSR